MFVKFFIVSTIVYSVRTVPRKPCNRLKINGSWYEREVILPNVGRPYHLIVHKSTNTLFFSFSLPDGYADVDFQLASLNLDTREYQVVAGIRGGCSVAIDQGNDEIYLGGSDGIYKYNVYTKLADHYKERGKNIWSLYFKENLFYISYPDQTLYIDVDGKFVRVSEFENFEVDHFHMAANQDIYFANKTGFYKLDSQGVIDCISDLLTVRQIAEDNNGVMYLCTNFGIYIHSSHEFTKIVNLKSVFGLAFDKDNNFIFSDEKNIIKLKSSDSGCIGDTVW